MANKATEPAKKVDIDAMIDKLVQNAQQALAEYMELNQEQVDKIVHTLSLIHI